MIATPIPMPSSVRRNLKYAATRHAGTIHRKTKPERLPLLFALVDRDGDRFVLPVLLPETACQRSVTIRLH